jgi:hypothetical protein
MHLWGNLRFGEQTSQYPPNVTQESSSTMLIEAVHTITESLIPLVVESGSRAS